MKHITLITLNIFTLLLIMSCNGSTKGKWSVSDKQKFHKEMETIDELSNFGENKTKWIDCYLSKVEANYSSYNEANKDENGCKKIALDCNKEVFSNGSIRGNWSESDKQKFRKDMEGIEEVSNLGEYKIKWIDCYLSKAEANYSSYYEANTDENGCKKMALECNEEIK